MNDLLRALGAARPTRARLLIPIGVGLVVIAGVAGSRGVETPCAPARAFDATNLAEVRDAIVGGGSEFRRDTWERLDPKLDDAVQAYDSAHAQTCALARAGTLDSRVADLRFACLARWRQRLDDASRALQEADDQAIARALAWYQDLETPQDCLRTSPTRAVRIPPAPPALAEPVRRARAEVDRATDAHDLGRFDEALTILEHARRYEVSREFQPLAADIMLHTARAHEQLGDWTRAERGFTEAFYAAQLAGYDDVEVRAAVGMVLLELSRGDSQAAARWLGHARAADHGVWPDLGVLLLGCEAQLLAAQDEIEAAVDVSRRALDLAQEGSVPWRLRMALTTETVARLHRSGRVEEALELARADLAEREAVLGTRHPWLAPTLDNLATAAWSAGQATASLEVSARAVELERLHQGDDGLGVAISQLNAGYRMIALGPSRDAADRLDEALGIFETRLPPEHPLLAVAVIARASSAVALGDMELAPTLVERARVLVEQAFGPDDVRMGVLMVVKGELLLMQDDPDPAAALEALQHGWKLLAPSAELEPPHAISRSRFLLAKASLAAGGEASRAIDMVLEARRMLSGKHPAEDRVEAEIDEWLADHRPSPSK